MDHPHPMRLAHLKRHAAQRLGSLARAFQTQPVLRRASLRVKSHSASIVFGSCSEIVDDSGQRPSPGPAEPRPVRPVSGPGRGATVPARHSTPPPGVADRNVHTSITNDILQT